MGVMTGVGQCAESRVPNLHFTESRMQKITIFAVINVIILIILANLTLPNELGLQTKFRGTNK